jgi:WD40 repeat protein
MNHDGTFFAIGGKSGILRVFEININCQFHRQNGKSEDENIMSYLNLINQKPYREYYDHKSDIIDLCWSHFNNKIILTASLDHFVILWHISMNYPYMKFLHSSMVTCISFCPLQVKYFNSRKMAMNVLSLVVLIGLYESGARRKTKSLTFLIGMNTLQQFLTSHLGI